MRKLPIGIQSFKELRTQGYLYVDKTAIIHQLVNEASYFFLSRPRRFGKSLLLSTLSELYKGKQALFKDLWIENHWDWTQQYPIIELKFNEAAYKDVGLEADITRRLMEIAQQYDIFLTQEQYVLQFRELILKLSAQYNRVVILIDEYDKPVIDFLDELPKAKANREILKNLYSVLKPLDDYLQLVFITGVTKFSRVSIFSELNNFLDISIHPDYATLFGYTHEELEHYFDSRIEQLAPTFGGKTRFLKQVKKWYNGYTWNTQHHVYNPFSILSFFHTRKFQNYWFETGTPTFLIKLLRKNNIYDMESIKTTSASFNSYDLDRISPETLMFETGYITMKQDLGMNLFELGYPNQEVRESMLQYLLADYTQGGQGTGAAPAVLMAHALVNQELDQLPLHINALLASIPYELHQQNEAYYHTVMHLAFSLIGVHIHSEIHVAKGRLDSIVHTDKTTYIFEFKVNRTAEEAIQQLKKLGYAAPYLAQNKTVLGIGVSFNTDLKEIDSWLVEQF